MTTERVQQWVLSVVISAVALFPIGALIFTADVKEQAGDTGTAVALCVMAMVIGLIALAACRLVHRLNPMSPYVALGILPGLGGLAYVLI